MDLDWHLLPTSAGLWWSLHRHYTTANQLCSKRPVDVEMRHSGLDVMPDSLAFARCFNKLKAHRSCCM